MSEPVPRGPGRRRRSRKPDSGAFVGFAEPESHPRCCIVGAGCSGFTTAKALQDRGLDFECFEASDRIGGNWAYRNPNGMSACYQSLHIDTSKYRMQFEDFPIPEHFPDFPHHSQILEYFNHYVDHFGLRERITFESTVERCLRRDDGSWTVEVLGPRGARTLHHFDMLLFANGHHWSPRWPTPRAPGEFAGIELHSHSYRSPFEPHDLRGKRVLVVGMGNSAMDIASELSQRPIAEKLSVSARRGVWIFPKYINGQPADKTVLPSWIPPRVQRWIAKRTLLRAVGRMENYGLPAPDHEPLEAHPSVSGEFLTRVGCGDIAMKPAIEAYEGKKVRFADGSSETIDAIVYATGYDISFPFLRDLDLPIEDNHLPLFKRVFRPDIPNLGFLGLAQSLPTLVNLAEQQARWIAAYLVGEYHLPDAEAMERTIERDERRYLGHYYDSARHRMQLDFEHYVADLRKEWERGERRAEREHNALPVPRLSSPVVE
ncbi:MAG: NAD(P)/FAD-dependent oxidoreductase [Acidobacteria bacterium]|nr:MAG: NAD(P)/FAD-dependent oxidoreductase [Acidobacteriota bacterium]